MNRFLVPLSLLIVLGSLPEAAVAATGPVVMGAHAPQKAARKSRPGSKPSSKPASGSKHSQPASRPASKPASQPASRPSQPAAQPSRSDASRSESRPDANRADSNRSDANRADPNRGAPNRADTRDGAHPGERPDARAPVGPRSVEFGAPRTAGAPVAASHGPRTPTNFRGATPVSRGPSDHASADRRSGHGEATARAHRDAAYASHSAAARDPRRDVDAAHRNAAARAHHQSRATAYHHAWSQAHRHYSWYQPRGWFVRWTPGRTRHWYHGVFVYGPPPWSPPPPRGEHRAAPPRHADHAGDLSLGLRGATYGGAYKSGDNFGDFGLGLAARYRFSDPLGVELQWVYHDDTWQQGTERIEQPLSASLELFAMPWAKVNPYLLGGITVTQRNVQDTVGTHLVEENRATWGPHVGLGLEFNLAERMSLSLDLRYLAALNLQPDDAARPGAVQGNLGLNFYF